MRRGILEFTHGSHSKNLEGLEETGNNLYAGYIQGAVTLVLASLLEDEKRSKCRSVVDDP